MPIKLTFRDSQRKGSRLSKPEYAELLRYRTTPDPNSVDGPPKSCQSEYE